MQKIDQIANASQSFSTVLYVLLCNVGHAKLPQLNITSSHNLSFVVIVSV